MLSGSNQNGIKVRKKCTVMLQGLKRAIWILGFKILNGNRGAHKCRARDHSHIKACPSDDFVNRIEGGGPQEGWRKLFSYSSASRGTQITKSPPIELDDDILERIDFLACLFGGNRAE